MLDVKAAIAAALQDRASYGLFAKVDSAWFDESRVVVWFYPVDPSSPGDPLPDGTRLPLGNAPTVVDLATGALSSPGSGFGAVQAIDGMRRVTDLDL